MKRIYIIENENGMIKIGISQEVENRINVLANQGGFKVVNIYSTKPCSNSYELKHYIHEQLNSYRIRGEWFRISFGDAVKQVSKIYAEMAHFEIKKQRCLTPDDISKAFKMSS